MKYLHPFPPENFSSQFEVAVCYCSWEEKRRQSHLSQGGTWTAPSGKLESEEPPIKAAIREVYEETSLSISESEIEPCGSYFFRVESLGIDYCVHLFKVALLSAPTIALKFSRALGIDLGNERGSSYAASYPWRRRVPFNGI